MKTYGAEFVGTFWLVLGGCGSAVLAAGFPEVGIGLLGVSLAFGLTVLTMAFAIGHISGCHLNPAVSVGLWAAGRFGASQLLPYIVSQVAGAIVASTLTTCAVFLPIIFVRGLAARLVGGLAFSVVVSLLVSLLVAVLLIPALAAWLLPRRQARPFDPGRAAVERMVAGLLRAPLLVVVVAGLLAAAGIWLLSGLGTELLPPSDPRQFVVRVVPRVSRRKAMREPSGDQAGSKSP